MSFLTPLLLTFAMAHGLAQNDISLAGRWEFALDPKDVGEAKGWSKKTLDDTITLPTTTDVAQKAPLLATTQEAWKLTRSHPYTGVAWYRRSFEVPSSWQGKFLWLSLERTKSTKVFVDGVLKGEDNGLSAPQRFKIGPLAAGEHSLALRVDNRLERWPDRVSASHMLEESTQTNWNGVIGKIEIGPSPIIGVTTSPGESPSKLHVHVNIDGDWKGKLTLRAFDESAQVAETVITGNEGVLDFAGQAKFWDEFSPYLYRLEVTSGDLKWSGPVGLRSFVAKDASFWINGRRTFLRGKHDGCVFPLTGHPPMDVAGWDHYFRVCKSYGINHIRFHSWCPPDAAFTSADHLGMYLQPELPFWGDPSKPGVESYLVEEGKRILRAFGHHPSFVMLSLGNEFWGDPLPRPRMVSALRAEDPSRLYAQGSNSESWNAHEFTGDDYRVSAYVHTTDEGAARGSFAHSDKRVGYIIAGTQGTSHTYSKALEGTTQPFVSHEVGQYQTYPDFKEIPKYTGVLRADNFAVFRDRLKKAGMLSQADDFVQASGRLSVLLYREEIESALRTPEMDGFDLLDLQDYPGQGSALVGILNAFMESKGLISPAEWRQFCGPVVPLALFEKYTYHSGDPFTAELRVANYGPDALNAPVRWTLSDGAHTIDSGEFAATSIPTGGVTTIGKLSSVLIGVDGPKKIKLTVECSGHHLGWPLWVYKSARQPTPSGVSIATKLDDQTLARLDQGEKVVLFPAAADLPGSIPGDFATDFWNYPMFKGGNPPGTLGYLIQDKHPALGEFPTEFHSDWQWQTLAHHSRTVILDSFPSIQPIVQTIDNFERNHRLGTIFEVKVGKGSLLVCTIDLPSMTDVPEAQQLMQSLLDYASSEKFAPAVAVDGKALRLALHGPGN